MPHNYRSLRGPLIALLLSGITLGPSGSCEKREPPDQTLEVIRDCMAQTRTQWPDEWNQEYIDAIRYVVTSHQDFTQYTARIDILRKGFAPYWEGFEKIEDRYLFEVHLARIRWYTEHLMSTKFPTEQERQKLRDQYTDIWDYASRSLLAQFPFLNPNAVQNAKQDDLSVCYGKIDAPLIPVYLRPFSEGQVTQIKERWDTLRYARVDLWRSLGGNSPTPSEGDDAHSPNAARDYQFTKKSLSQLLGLVWMVVPQRPDYYLIALENQNKALQQRVQSKRQARSDQQRLEKERSRQLLQAEHISFLLAALLETQRCLRQSASTRPQEEIPSAQRDRTVEGEEVVPMR